MTSASQILRQAGVGPLPLVGAPRYSLHNALLGEAHPSARGFEHEVSDELRASLGGSVSPAGGTLIPVDVLAGAPITTAPGSGGPMVFEGVGPFASLLRPHLRLEQLGATFITDSRSPVRLVRQTGTVDVVWTDEAEPVTDPQNPPDPSLPPESAASFAEEGIAIKTGSATTSFTRQLERSATPQTEALVERDLRRALAGVVDRAGIAGTGTDSQPRGVLHRADVPVLEIGVNGGALTYAHLVELEHQIGQAHADEGSVGLLTTPGMRKHLRTLEVPGGGGVAWQDGRVLDVPARASDNVPSDLVKGTSNDCHGLVFGAWEHLVVQLIAVEVIVDHVSLVRQGIVEVTLVAYVGVGLQHPQAFRIIRDARVS